MSSSYSNVLGPRGSTTELHNVVESIKSAMNSSSSSAYVVPDYLDGAGFSSPSPSSPNGLPNGNPKGFPNGNPNGRKPPNNNINGSNSSADDMLNSDVLHKVDSSKSYNFMRMDATKNDNIPWGSGGRKQFAREDEIVLDRLETATTLDRLLTPPNVNPDLNLADEIMRIVNVNGCGASRTLFGKVIEPGKIGIINDNGQLQVIGEGRWNLWSPRVDWVNILSLTDIPITQESLFVIRVPRGEYGLATDNGTPKILAEGLHVRNSRLFTYNGLQHANQKHLCHGTINILIVPTFEYALVMENAIPKILKAGTYVIDSSFFRVEGFIAVNNVHIEHHTLHIVRVPQGKVGLVSENNRFHLLYEGSYFFNAQMFTFSGLRDLIESVINHGTITRFRIRNGELGLAWHDNKPVFIEKPDFYEIDSPNFNFIKCVPATEKVIILGSRKRFIICDGEVGLAWHNNKPIFIEKPDIYEIDLPNFTFEKCIPATEKFTVLGSRKRFIVYDGEVGLAWHNNRPVFIEKPDIYEIDSPTFTFVKCVAASDKHITLGSRKRFIVYDGEVGISYVNGRLEILQPKTHTFDETDRTFLGFMSTRQQMLPLVEDDSKTGFLRCDTKDFVEVGIKACVFYRISDPEKCLLCVGDEKAISKLIKETSIATLQSIMRSSGLNQVAQSKHVHALKEEAPKEGPSAPLFFDKVHDEFIFHLHETFFNKYGIEIANIRIESFKIMNNALAENISQQAIITAQTETKLANLEGQREIATAEMEREAEVTRIKTQAASRQSALEAETRNNTIVAEAKAKAQSAKIVAQGDADSLLIKAEAEAKAIELKAAAERKRAEELSATALGEKLALLTIQAQMVTQSMQGVQKVIYLPSNASLAQTPLQLFGNIYPPFEEGAFGQSQSSIAASSQPVPVRPSTPVNVGKK